LRTDVFFIRAQSAIRADGTPPAQARSLQPEPGSKADLQGLSAYQNIQGAGTTCTVDSRARLG
jgi:hypothetical protein